MAYIALLILISCSDKMAENDEFKRDEFENEWWGFESFDMCFNIHESGELLTYQDRINSEGSWTFSQPSSYVVDGEYFDIQPLNDKCWYIDFTGRMISDTACECRIIEQ